MSFLRFLQLSKYRLQLRKDGILFTVIKLLRIWKGLFVAYLCYLKVCYKNLGKQGRRLVHETPYCLRHFKSCKQNGIPECQTVRYLVYRTSGCRTQKKLCVKCCLFSVSPVMKGSLPSAVGNNCTVGDCSMSHYSEGYKAAMNLTNVATLAVLALCVTQLAVCKYNCHLRLVMKKRYFNT